MNTFLKLPLTFAPVRLLEDLRVCEPMEWVPHFNAMDYSGRWSSISLRSATGNASDILSHPGCEYRDTPLLARCPYFRELLDSFRCEKESVRLLSLAPGSRINEHRDLQTGYQYNVFRVHIPLKFNGDVSFVVGGHSLNMAPGECWYADFSQTHYVENHGSDARINLILDCKRNDWSDQLFKAAGYDFDAESKAKRPDPATRAQIIAQLSEMKTETANQLIQQLLADAQPDSLPNE